jgi:pimeloyl-ACP methyl ester carboxylesterase
MAYAAVHEPDDGEASATLVFGHGIGVENDLWRETVDSVLLLVRDGIRVIEITGPWHGLRAQRGRYGGEPFFATAPLGVLDLFTAEVPEMAVLIDWARRRGSPRVGLGGVSLGALVAQLALVHAGHWPAACRPDAALLITHAGHIEQTAAGGSLTRGLGLIEAMEEAGWSNDEFASWRALTDPIGEPVMEAGKIVSVLASRDDVTPFASGRELVRDWGIPPENLFIMRQGHFSLPLALLRDRRPFARFARILRAG